MNSSNQKIKKDKTLKRQSRQTWTWVSWMLTSAFTGLIGLGLVAEIPPFVTGVIPSGDEANITGYSNGWAVILGGFLTGATFGGFQWIFMGRLFARYLSGWWWICVSALAVGVSFTFAWVIGGGRFGENFAHHGLPHAVDPTGIWGGLLFGLVLGLAQWLVLWFKLPDGKTGKKNVWVWWWVPVNLSGFGVGWWVAALLSAPSEQAFGPWNHSWGGLVFGTVFGGFTGVVVAKLGSVRKTISPRKAE